MKKFKTGVAMKVTQEQYDKDLKLQLVSLGYTIDEYWNSKYNPSSCSSFCNILLTESHGRVSFHTHYSDCHKIDNYNPELYLALAAMTKGDDWIVGEYLVHYSRKPNIVFKCKRLVGSNSRQGYADNKNKNLYRKATKEEILRFFNNKSIKREETMKYKFSVGDRVKIIRNGSGCGHSAIGELVTIAELGEYGEYTKEPGYKIEEKSIDTNTKTGSHKGFIGESSFGFIEKPKPDFKLSDDEATIIPYDKVEETLQMFKSKLEYGFDEEMESFKEYKKNKDTVYLKYRGGEYFIHYMPEGRTVIPNTIQYKEDIKQFDEEQSYRDYFMSMPNWFKAIIEEEQSNQGVVPRYENALQTSHYFVGKGSGGFSYSLSVLGERFWQTLTGDFFVEKRHDRDILDYFIEQDKISMLRKVIHLTSPEYDYIVQKKQQLDRKKREYPVPPDKAYRAGIDPFGQSDRGSIRYNMFPVEELKLRKSQLEKKKLQGVQEIEEVSVPLYKKSKSRKF